MPQGGRRSGGCDSWRGGRCGCHRERGGSPEKAVMHELYGEGEAVAELSQSQERLVGAEQRHQSEQQSKLMHTWHRILHEHINIICISRESRSQKESFHNMLLY